MAVCSYYCVSCGVKLRFEEARHGRTDLRANAFYCPSCVIDHDIPVVEPPPSGEDPLVLRRLRGSRVGPIDLGSGELGRVSSQRLAPVHGVRGRVAGPRRAPATRRHGDGRWAWLGGLAVGLALSAALGMLVLRETRPAGAAGPEQDAPAAAVMTSVGAGAGLAAGGANAAPAAQPGPRRVPAVELVGSRRSGKVHRADCRYAARIATGNRVVFSELEQARAQGFAPCRVCLGESGGR